MSGEPKELRISVDTGNIQALLKHVTEVDHANKLLLEEKEQARLEFEKALSDKELERVKLKDELAKTGGSGVLPANLGGQGEGSNSVNSREYEGNTLKEAYHNMIDDLRAKGDTETLNKLLAKGLPAFKTNFEYIAPIVTNSKGDVIDSPIRRTLKKQTGVKQ